jgi:hypothetical protein
MYDSNSFYLLFSTLVLLCIAIFARNLPHPFRLANLGVIHQQNLARLNVGSILLRERGLILGPVADLAAILTIRQ